MSTITIIINDPPVQDTKEKEVTTENQAKSYPSTGDTRLDLFSKVCRDTPEDHLHHMLKYSWKLDPLDTLKIIFHLRDCRGGKGERLQFYRSLQWLLENHPKDLKINIPHIPFYGRYKDLLVLLGTKEESYMISLFTDRLKEDKKLLETGNTNQISLAAKYAPTEGQACDKKYQASSKFASKLGVNLKVYRKEWLVPLRKHLKIIDHYMTNQTSDWELIDFSKVPSVAFKKYKKAFEKHQEKRYHDFLNKVRTGETKMNVLRLMPHEIVGAYIRLGVHPSSEVDQTVETQWFSFVKQTKAKMNFKNALAVVDVSGSMNTADRVKPILVSTSLGLLLAELTDGPFHGKFFTFSEQPVLETVTGDTLYDQLTHMTNTHWGQSTNIQAVFKILLSYAKMFKVTEEQMPQTIFIFSDMQFNQCCTGNESTNWEAIKLQYEKTGYKLPKLVFWNLRGNTFDFPVPKDEENVVLIGGYSADLLKLIIDGESLSPINLMLKAIHDTRYDRIVLYRSKESNSSTNSSNAISNVIESSTTTTTTST